MTRAAGRLGAVALVAASLLLPLAAHADERDVDGGSVTITVQIDPLECTTGCGGGSLPATGLVSPEPLAWIALALLVAGAVFALRARMTRRARAALQATGASAYAMDDGDGIPVAQSGGAAASLLSPSLRDDTGRREIERGDGACPK